MTKLKAIELEGFRGARHPLSVDLTSKTRSVAVFGDNGSGKSSITDALEWFFTDRVEHLWREDCQAQALRNVNMKEGESSTVSIDFDAGPPVTKKVLNSKLASTFEPKTKDLTDYLAQASSERLILRNHELTQFVAMRKGEKRRHVANIIGYDVVTSFRDAIQQTLNALKISADYVAAKKTLENHRAELLKVGGEIITTEGKYYEVLDSLLKPFDLKCEKQDSASLEACRTILKGRIKQEEKAARKLALRTLSGKLNSLKDELEALKLNRDAFVPKYRTLVQNVEELQKLHLGDFLKKGKAVLDQAKGLDGKCPFCLTDTNLDALSQSVSERIELLEATQNNYQSSKAAMDAFIHTAGEVSRLCKDAHLAAAGAPCSDEFVTVLLKLSDLTKEHKESVPSACAAYQELADDAELLAAEKQISASIAAEKSAIEAAEAKEVLTHEEESIVDVLGKMKSIKEHFEGHQADTRTIAEFETQIRTLQKLFDEFVKVQTSAMQNALNIMSKDIGRFYNAMHPHENAEEVHLTILGDEGVEFSYKFHGKEVHPPMKYLSESHLNSLGVALFLRRSNSSTPSVASLFLTIS